MSNRLNDILEEMRGLEKNVEASANHHLSFCATFEDKVLYASS
jgi:hypothetical protein